MTRKRPLEDPNQYYVYIWRFEGEVIYVGQGKGNRGRAGCRASWAGRRWELVKLLEESSDLVLVKILPCASQQESRVREASLIKRLKPKYNRAPHYGGFKGMHTEQGLKNISEALTGKKMPEGFGEKIRQRMKDNQNLLGHNPSKETRAKISKSLQGREISELTKQKSSERMTERNTTNPPRKGKTCSDEHKRKVSEGRKRYYQTLKKKQD